MDVKVKYGPHYGGSNSIDLMIIDCIANDWRTMQIFLGNSKTPNKRRKLTQKEIIEANMLIKNHSFQVYTHFPYTLNLCKPQSLRQLSGLNGELLQMSLIGGRVIIHPNSPAVIGGQKNSVTKKVLIGGDGNKLKAGCCQELIPEYGEKCARVCEQWVAQCDSAIDVLIANLNLLKFPKTEEKYQLLLEGCAFEGQKIMGTFGQIEAIAKKIKNLPVGFCIDTCHAFASGMSKFNTVEAIDEFFFKLEKINVISMVKAIHLNDSSDPFFSCKDHHAPLCCGYIWNIEDLKPLQRLGYYCKIHKIDIICEVGIPSDFAICSKIFA